MERETMNNEPAATPDAVKEIIDRMKILIEHLEGTYEDYLRDGPEGHLTGNVIDRITALCELVEKSVNYSGPPLPRNDDELRAKLREIAPL
jgi:hypothetical protein